MRWAQDAGAHQVTFRKMGEPRNLSLPGSKEVAQWIRSNYVNPQLVIDWLRERVAAGHATEKDQWPWAVRFGFEGMSVVVTEHMTAPIKEEVRHGVVQPDGHLYGSWDDPADIII